jgi:hypothetical protein
MTTIVVAETAVLVLLTVLVTGLLRSHAEILRRLHALGAGLDPDAVATAPVALRPKGDTVGTGLGPAHDVAGAGLRDDAVIVPVAGVEHRTLLAFLSSGCLTCRTFWEALADEPSLGLPPDVRVVAVAKDAAEESVAALREVAPADLPVVLSSDAWRDYEVPGSPYFVLVDGPAARVRGEGTGVSWDQVRNLIVQSADDAAAGEQRPRAGYPGEQRARQSDRAASGASARERASSPERERPRAGYPGEQRARQSDRAASGASARERASSPERERPRAGYPGEQRARQSDIESRIDRELLAHGIRPGDPSLYRTADEIAHEARR